MPQYGAYANRNAGHKEHWAAKLASAGTDRERLAVAYDWFRASTKLLSRRRPPEDVDQEVHRATAARLAREAAEYLIRLAGEIDRGEHDAQKG